MENELNGIYGDKPIENENSVFELVNEKKRTLVKQDNVFIRATNQTKFSVNEKKILTYLFCEIKENQNCIEKENEIYYKIKISKKEIIQKLYADKKGKWNSNIAKDIKNLENRTIDYIEPNGTTLVITHIIFESKIDPYNDEMLIYFNKKVANDFIKIFEKQNFSRYFLETFIKLNNKYAQRMYEYFCSFRGLAKQNGNKLIYLLKIDKDNFYKIFLENENGKLKTKSYENFYNLKVKVIDKALKNIKNNTDISVDFTKVGLNLQFKIDFTNNDFARENEIIKNGIAKKEMYNSAKNEDKNLKEKSKNISKPKKNILKNTLDNKTNQENYNQILINSISNPDFK